MMARKERFVMLEHGLIDSEAYQNLSGTAVKALTLMMRRYSGHNNGEITYGVREMADRLGMKKDAASRALLDLEIAGFIARVKKGRLGSRGQGVASMWRLTMFGCDEAPATRDYMARG